MSPFQAIYGYNPEFNVPIVDECLKALKEVQDNIWSALELAAEQIKYFYNKKVRDWKVKEWSVRICLFISCIMLSVVYLYCLQYLQ